MKAHFKLVVLTVLSALLLSGCFVSGGGRNRSGGAFISAGDGSGRPTQRQQGYPGYRSGQPMYVGQQGEYGGQPMYAQQGMYYGPGGSIRTAPCQPVQADALMAWAQGTGGNSQHTRSAQVTSNNGYVNCYTSEGASSSMSRSAK